LLVVTTDVSGKRFSLNMKGEGYRSLLALLDPSTRNR